MSGLTKERPMLFSGAMVRAIQGARKTQTRRAVKVTHRTPGLAACLNPPVGAPRPRTAAELCPYGQPGDRLWVRETWGHFGGDEYLYQQERTAVSYRADATGCTPIPGGRWRPSIHMPRWASRILLEVTGVRVERLQDISEADAIAEGVDFDLSECPFSGQPTRTPLLAYRQLWNGINGAGSWDANPWVWVIEFKRVEQQ